MTKKLTLLACLGMLALPLHAQTAPAAAPVPDWAVSGNATLVSDYIFRGVSQTQHKPTGQATVDLTHVSGAYLGFFGSGVSWAAYNNGSGSEIDIYGGYRIPMGEGSNVDLGVVSYLYPGSHYTADGHRVTYHTLDLKAGWNEGAFNAYAWLTASRNWFGFGIDPATGKYADSRGTWYVEANWNPELAPGLVLNLHAGRQNVRHFSDFNFFDVKAGVTKTWDSWAVSGSVIYNNGKATRNGLPYWTFFDADGGSRNVVGTRLLLTAGRNF